MGFCGVWDYRGFAFGNYAAGPGSGTDYDGLETRIGDGGAFAVFDIGDLSSWTHDAEVIFTDLAKVVKDDGSAFGYDSGDAGSQGVQPGTV